MMINLITKILMMISQDVIEEAAAAPRCDHDPGDCSPPMRSFFCLPINMNLSPINMYVEKVQF